MTTNERTVGRYLCWLLAALSLGAGVIHFAVSGGHFDVSWMHGAFFAVVAWLQLSFAVAVILRPSRRLLATGVLLNAAIVGVWVMSRVWGVPVGPDAWTPEPVTLADALASSFEGGIVVLSLAVLVRPAIAQRSLRPALAIPGLGITGVAVAVISTVALTPSFASAHHGSTAGSSNAAGGHAGHGVAAPSNAGADKAVNATPCGKSGPPASVGQVVEHGHRGPVGWQPITDPQQRVLFDQQAAVAHGVTLQYATVKDAEAAGYHKVTAYVPCIGAHYINAGYMVGGFNPAHPSMLLYDGTKPDSKIVGLSYSVLTDPKKAPEGFVGPNDPWHKHSMNGGLCLGRGGVVGSENTSAAECARRGGKKVPLDNLWMMHMWNVDGWPSSWGLFSSEHPDLGGRINDINGKPDPNGVKNA